MRLDAGQLASDGSLKKQLLYLGSQQARPLLQSFGIHIGNWVGTHQVRKVWHSHEAGISLSGIHKNAGDYSGRG